MSTLNGGWRGGNIVREGLVMYMDAASGTSYNAYINSGTWRDISGNGYTASLNSGPTFSNDNGGTFVFGGSANASGSIGNIFSNAITQEAWVYHTTLNTTNIQRYVSIWTNAYALEQCVIRSAGYIGAGSLQGFIQTSTGYKFIDLTNQLVINTWYHVALTWNGTTLIMYKNGTQVGTNTPTGTLVSSTNYPYQISSDGEGMIGRISNARVYNRGLSAAEVRQNYNATRARFGL